MRGAYAHFRQHLMVLANYRVNMAVWNLVSALQMLVYLAVWSAVATAQGGEVSGYTASTFAAYYLTMLFVRTIQVPSIVWKLSGEVRRGEFDVRLLRPYHPALAIHFSELGATLMTTANILVIGVPLAFAFGAVFDASALAMLAAVALAPLWIVTRYLMDSLLATLAFRYTRIEGFRSVFLIGAVFLGGQFVPLDIAPDWFTNVAYLLPFYWTLGFPVELFIGRAPLGDAATGALVLAAWAAVLFVAFRFAWARGLRRLETVGS